jgi:hypothetical protein
MRIGSEAHKELFCRTFIASHREYDPEKLPWPDLDGPSLDRLRGLPFWGEAVVTEMEAGAKINAYAGQVADPILQEAIALQAAEELRHAIILQTLLQRYDVRHELRPAAPLPTDLEQAFVNVGYGECIDSFFAFGLFDIARQSGVFPKALLDVVEPIVDEEARHIVFFVNWEAHQQANHGRKFALQRGLRGLRYYSRAARRRLGALRNSNSEGFTASGAQSVSGFALDLTAEYFLSVCLRENARRMANVDADLLRPQFVPALARRALQGLTLVSRLTRRRGHDAAAGFEGRRSLPEK